MKGCSHMNRIYWQTLFAACLSWRLRSLSDAGENCCLAGRRGSDAWQILLLSQCEAFHKRGPRKLTHGFGRSLEISDGGKTKANRERVNRAETGTGRKPHGHKTHACGILGNWGNNTKLLWNCLLHVSFRDGVGTAGCNVLVNGILEEDRLLVLPLRFHAVQHLSSVLFDEREFGAEPLEFQCAHISAWTAASRCNGSWNPRETAPAKAPSRQTVPVFGS